MSLLRGMRGLPGNVAICVVVVATLLAAQALLDLLISREILSAYTTTVLSFAGINVIMAASLNLVNGVAGQFSIGHAGFMAVGAYTSATVTLASAPSSRDAPVAAICVFIASLLAGGAVAALAGYLVGLPSLRLRGDYLAIVTLGFGEIIRVVIVNVDALGGSRGLGGIQNIASFFWIWLVVAATLLTLHRIARSDYGRTLLAIREDEIAAAAMGVDTTAKKVGAFTIAAFFAGVGGGLFAHTLAYLNPNSFKFDTSFNFVVMVILGGMGSLSGSVLAAGILTVLLELLRPTTLAKAFGFLHLPGAGDWVQQHDFRISIYAMLLILIMILRPRGLFGSSEAWDTRPVRWLWRLGRRGPAFPASPPDGGGGER